MAKKRQDDVAWKAVIDAAVAGMSTDIDDRIKLLDSIITIAPQDHPSTARVVEMADALLAHRRMQFQFHLGGGQ